MIWPRMILVLSSLLLIATPAPAQSFSGPVFVDATGVFSAHLQIQDICSSVTTLTLTIHRPAGDDVRSVVVKNVLLPDLCMIACFDCPVPFTWSIVNAKENVALEGGGMAGFAAAYSVQGPFQEGALEFRGVGGVTFTLD